MNDPDDELPSGVAWPWLPSDWVDAGSLENWNLELSIPPDPERHEALCASLIGKEPALIMQFSSDNGRYDGKGGVRIDLVSAASCRAVLQLFDCQEPGAFEDERIVTRLVNAETTPPTQDGLEAYICRSKENSLARTVEESLFLGRPDCRLDALLDQVCGRVAADVSAFLQPFKMARRRTRDEILKLWQDANPT